MELHKVMERCSSTDKRLSSELSILNEKIYILETTIPKCEEEIEALKTNWDETIVSFDNMKEDLQCIEKEMAILTEFPGLRNRVEQLEVYVYSGYESEYEDGEQRKRSVALVRPQAIIPEDKLLSKAGKIAKKLTVSDKKHVEKFKPTFKKMEKKKAQDIEDFFDEDERISESDVPVKKKFVAYSRNVVLIQDMEKRKHTPKFEASDLSETFEEEEDYLYEEPIYEIAKKSKTDEDFGEISEAVTPKEMAEEYSSEEIQSSTFTSSDLLEEHSRQLKGQVIVFVKKRLHMFEIDLQHIEGSVMTMMKKVEFLEKCIKELGEKLTFLDANFNQRAGDFTALKEMTENHHLSILTIMHHLDRKAEAYAVNQKVSRKELTVIEDRVLKLCVTSSTELAKMEEKIDDSLKDLSLELDKKLFTGEFEIRLELLLHKIKLMEKKLKEVPVETSVLDFEGIRPIEVKKYVLSKDGTRVKQARKNVASWKHDPTESIIPVLTHHLADQHVSPKTAIKVQRELELASIRDSKRYVEGAYTKIKVGKK